MRKCYHLLRVCAIAIWFCCSIGGCSKEDSNQGSPNGGAGVETGGTQYTNAGSQPELTPSGGAGSPATTTASGGTPGSTDAQPVIDASEDGASSTADAAITVAADSQIQTQPDTAITTDGTVDPADADLPRSTNCLQGSGDYTEDGPYEVATRDIEVPSFGTYTLFYPANLEAECPHPIVSWGNGTGVSGSETYTHFNHHAASWGMVAIASHSSESISIPYVDTGVDWLLEQNNDPSSEFYQKLSSRAGAAGHSQGGRAATDATHHNNIVAAVSVQGGNTPAPDAAFMCLTGVEDVARERCTLSYEEAQGPAFLADHEAADHMATPTTRGRTTPAGIQYKRLLTAWFRCFLADDPVACSLFKDGCSLCSEPGWARIEGKNM